MPKRIVRRIEVPTKRAFDERLWPTLFALALLAAFTMGTVVAYLPFGAARWYGDAATYLVLIPLAGLVVALWMALVDTAARRRTIQLSAVLCLLVHVLLLIATLETYLFRNTNDEVATKAPAAERKKKQVEIPIRFEPERRPAPARPWEEPVATPEEVDRQVEKVVRDKPEPQQPRTAQPIPVETPEPTVEPRTVRRREIERSRAAVAAAPSQRSRRETKQPKPAAESVELAATEPQRPAAPSVTAQATRRTSDAASAEMKRPNRAVNAPSPTPANNVARRASSEVPRVAAADASPRRTAPVPQASPQRIAARPSRTERSPTPNERLPAALRIVGRRTAARESASRPRLTPEPTSPNPSERTARRAVELDRAALVASADAPRRRRQTHRPAAAVTASVAPSQTTRTPSTALEADAVTARTAPTAASQVERSSADVPQENLRALPRVPEQRMRTRTDRASEVASAQAPPTRRNPLRLPARATVVAATSSRPTAVETRSSANDAFSAAAAVDRGRQGIAGRAASPNVERSTGGVRSPSSIASGQMPRRAATQSSEPGAALTPLASAERPRRRASLQTSGTATAVQATGRAGRRAAEQASVPAAGAAATRVTAAANATPGRVTGAPGQAAIDLDIPRRVAEPGRAGTSGGGGPTIDPTTLAKESHGGEGRGGTPGRSPLRPTPAVMTATLPGNGTTAGSEQTAAANKTTGTDAATLAARNGTARRIAGPTGAAREGDIGTSPNEAAPLGSAGASGQAVQRARLAEAAGADSPAIAPGGGARGVSRRPAGPLALAMRTSDPGLVATAGGLRGDRLTSADPGDGTMQGTGTPADRGEVLAASGGSSKGTAGKTRDAAAAGLAAAEAAAGSRRRPGGSGESAAAAARGGAAAPIEAENGPGGLGVVPASVAGIARRERPVEAALLVADAGRFPRRRPGGVPDLNPSVLTGMRPFQRRMERTKKNPQAGGRPSGELAVRTEKAIELGLLFLRRCQESDGRWRLERFDDRDGAVQIRSDAAATGLALLAFQGAGYHHQSEKHGEAIRAAIDFLIEHQQENGALYVSTDESSDRYSRFYTHGIATIALCEAYGMTQDPRLQEPARRAVTYIVQTQNPVRGGWRYRPKISSDTSVTGWMMMALKSAQISGIDVPGSTMDRIDHWLERAMADETTPYLYRYNPDASDAQAHGRRPTPTMTSVGLLMQLYAGWNRKDERLRRGADYLLKSPPAIGTLSDPRRDTYYWYYATQVLYHMGGDYWQQWYDALYPMLIDGQETTGDLAGSWDPVRPVPDRWAPHGGRIYVTTMNLLSLEVRYRILPLYEKTVARRH